MAPVLAWEEMVKSQSLCYVLFITNTLHFHMFKPHIENMQL